MNPLSGLNFSTRDAACHSLRVLAEAIRAGTLNMRLTDIVVDHGYARIEFETPDCERLKKLKAK
jgi:hypothetical protein